MKCLRLIACVPPSKDLKENTEGSAKKSNHCETFLCLGTIYSLIHTMHDTLTYYMVTILRLQR